MELEFLIFILIIVGLILRFKDKERLNQLVQKITYLEKVLAYQTTQIEKLKTKVKEVAPEVITDKPPETEQLKKHMATEPADNVVAPAAKASAENRPKTPDDTNETTAQSNPWLNRDAGAKTARESTVIPPATANIETKINSNGFSLEVLLNGSGLFWLGAIVLALGGVFLAKYSIEAGLLPPAVRVILGSLFGVALVAAAEYADRHKTRFNIQTPYISSALASGGVITCFAMAFVAFDFYQFISPNIAFLLLAFIAIAATYLALRFGPILAGIGIIGAYAVPALVSTGSNNVIALLLYVSFVSLSAVWVANVVKQQWLWWLSIIGHFIWFVAAVLIAGSGQFAALILFTLTTLYLYVGVSVLGWRLNQGMTDGLPIKALLMPRKEQLVVVLSVLLLFIHLLVTHNFTTQIAATVILSIVFMFVAYRHSAFDSWPFLLLIFTIGVFNLLPGRVDFADNLFPFSGKYLFIQVAVLVAMAFCAFMLRRFQQRPAYLLLLVLAPLTLYGVSYLVSPPQAETYLYPLWAFELLVIAGIASYCAMKASQDILRMTLLILSNTMVTLFFTMLLSASTLTLAIAAQIASMSYLSWKFKVRIPDWLYKAALLVVVTRLTFAPWLADYKNELILNIHWTLVVYPLVLAILWFSSKYNPSAKLVKWFSGVFVHVVALLVTTETSYQLTGGYPQLGQLSYAESVLLALNWLILGGVYLWRRRFTSELDVIYKYAGLVLIAGSGLLHLDVSIVNSPFFESQQIGGGIFNWLMLQWFIPALVLFGFVRFLSLDDTWRKTAYSVMGVMLVLFVNGEIRALFNDGDLVIGPGIKQAELYTYSIVWLLLSTGLIFAAQYFKIEKLKNIGFIGLGIVIFKAFGVDMAHLQGLLRALSFIGLGLCLVGIGWLFQRMTQTSKQNV